MPSIKLTRPLRPALTASNERNYHFLQPAPVLHFQSFVTPVAYQAISLRVASDDLAKIPIHGMDLIISGRMVTELMVAVPMVTVLAMVGVARDHHRLMTRRLLPDCSFGTILDNNYQTSAKSPLPLLAMLL